MKTTIEMKERPKLEIELNVEGRYQLYLTVYTDSAAAYEAVSFASNQMKELQKRATLLSKIKDNFERGVEAMEIMSAQGDIIGRMLWKVLSDEDYKKIESMVEHMPMKTLLRLYDEINNAIVYQYATALQEGKV